MAEQYILLLVPHDSSSYTNLGIFGSTSDAANAARAQAQSLLSGQGAEFRIYKISNDTLVETHTKADYVDAYKTIADNLDNQLQNIQQQLDIVRAATGA